MDCLKIQSLLLPDDAWRALPFWQRWQVAVHLRRCSACRAEREALSRVDAVLHGVSLPAAPGGLWERIEAQLPAPAPEQARPAPLPWWTSRPAWAVAAAAAILLLSIYLYRPAPQAPQAEGPAIVQAEPALETEEDEETLYYHHLLARRNPLNDNPMWDLMAGPVVAGD